MNNPNFDDVMADLGAVDGAATGVIQNTFQNLQQQIQQLQQQLQQMQVQSQQAQQGGAQGAQGVQAVTGPVYRLPSAVKVEKPSVFKGQSDGNTVETFIYQCEMYFGLVNLTDENVQGRLAAMLLVDDASIWFRSLGVDLTTLLWPWLRTALRQQFRPVDYLRRARDAWANCVQTGGVTGYTNQFRRLLVQVSDASQAEALDRFVRGLRPFLRQQVLIQDPATWEAAALIAERVSLASYSRGGMQGIPGNRMPRSSAGAGSSSGVAPMELGHMSGSGQPRQGRKPGVPKREVVCFLCKQPGHYRKDCPVQRKGQGPKNGPKGH